MIFKVEFEMDDFVFMLLKVLSLTLIAAVIIALYA